MLKKKDKEKIIKEYEAKEGDTGSTEVQCGLLSEEIDKLLKHLKKHPKDVHSKKGLLQMVSKRRKLLKYIQENNEKKYNKLVKKLGLKKRNEKPTA